MKQMNFLVGLTLITILTLIAPKSVLAQPRTSTTQSANLIPDILKYVNEHRAGMNLPPLAMNDYISTECETHSKNMASDKVPFGHNGFDERSQRIKTKLKNINYWAENVAMSSKSAREIVDMWLKSPEHRKNMEGNYNLTGLGIAKDKTGGTYITQIFVLKKQDASNTNNMIPDILKYVNEHRAGINLTPLQMNDYISSECETHSKNMATGKVPFSHTGFEDRAKRIKSQLKNVTSWAENVAFGDKTARQVVDMWLNSPGHRKNIEGNYNLSGIGIATDKTGNTFFTQIFILQK